jgi:hypothetical protein
MSACKWAGTDRIALDVPTSPAVWIDVEESTNVKIGCERAAGACNVACGGGMDTTKAAVSLNSCFQFIGVGEYVSLMCQCEDGRYPDEIVGFEAMTSVDGDGKVPAGAGRIGRGMILMVVVAMMFML